MIDNYLYHLYLNAPVFKDKSTDDISLKNYFTSEISKICADLAFTSQSEMLDLLLKKEYSALHELFSKYPLLEIFYLVNSFGEYSADKNAFDELGRLKYVSSLQLRTGIEKNMVLEKMLQTKKHSLVLANILKLKEHKSYFFLSHDIDSIYGSLMQDGLWALKNGRVDIIFKLLFNTVTQKPGWLNIDKIMKLESEYDFRSTFYWLVNKGKIDSRQTNADYDIQSNHLRDTFKQVEENGFENGLHKSISVENFETEIKKAPFSVLGNRYHYLKFKLPDAYNALKESGLKADASLGFAEHYGFRNNYGYPFHPFDIGTGKPYPFLEIPLNIMDGTFQRYMQVPVHETADTIIKFLEKNNTNSLISILWHNTFFSKYKYKGYLQEYKKVLSYLYESKFNCLNQKQIVDQFSWKS